jgi:uncharacterized protein (DUF1015 family)
VPILKPFNAIQAKPEYIQQVTSNSANYSSEEELAKEMFANDLSFLHVAKNHMISSNTSRESAAVYDNAKSYFDYLFDNQIVDRFKDEIFFVYRQTYNDISHTGIIGLCDILDYQNEKILKHEHTRPATERFIENLVEETNIIGEPLLLSHHHKQSLEDLLRWVIQGESDVTFTKKGKTHQIWVVQDNDVIESIQNEVAEIGSFYIMDGHHRAASVSNLYLENEDNDKRYCMTYLLDCNQLKINPFHRIVRSSDLSVEAVFNALNESFWVDEMPDYAVRPEESGEFVLKCTAGTFRLKLKNVVELLDVQEFEKKVLSVIFGIKDSRLDDRIEFISTDEALTEAVVQAQSPDTYLFLLHPCNFEDVALISDNGEYMPPKSTFVQPKCDAGLFMQRYGVVEED